MSGPDAAVEDGAVEDGPAELYRKGWTLRRSFTEKGGHYGGALQKRVDATAELYRKEWTLRRSFTKKGGRYGGATRY